MQSDLCFSLEDSLKEVVRALGGAKVVGHKLRPEGRSMTREEKRNRMARAVERMTHYVSTYNQQSAFQDYEDLTFVMDMLYGISLALGYEAGPDGFAKFKADWEFGK